MNRNQDETTVTLSVLDRLIDLQPANEFETALSRAEAMRQFRKSVRRDLEWLLNTRASIYLPPDMNDPLRESVYGYGLPDLSQFNVAVVVDRNRLVTEIERAIKRFEKRLDRVQVTLLQKLDQAKKDVHFKIDAVLRMDAVRKQVTYDSVIELKSGICRLSEVGDAR